MIENQKPYFKRVCKVNISGRVLAAPPLTIEFDMEFSGGSVQTAKAKIFNPAPLTIQKCVKKAMIIIEAGYEADAGTVISGEVLGCKLSRNGRDRVLEIIIGESSKKWLKAYVNKSYRGPIAANTVIQDIFQTLGIRLAPLDVDNKQYKDGISLAGSLGKVCRQLAHDTNSVFHFRNGRMSFLKTNSGGSKPFILSPAFGLLSAMETDKGFKLKILFNYQICGGCLLLLQRLKSESIRLRVTKGKHSFRLRGAALTEVEAIKL